MKWSASNVLLWLETFNAINVNTEYRVKFGKILFHLSFIQNRDIFFNNYYFGTLNVYKTSLMA